MVVVGGAGAMGRIVVRDLARSPGVERVTVADLDAGRAGAVAADAARGGDAEVTGVGADITATSFPDALRGHDVCVASTAYRLNPLIAEACLVARCSYVDLGGLFHVAQRTLELHERFRDAGLTGVTCMGGAPGITNLLAVVAARELDAVDAIHIRVGSADPSIEDVPLPIPYSLETVLDEFSAPAMAWRDGGFVEVAPLGDAEVEEFPDPIGRRETVTTLHSEVATLARAFPDAREVTFKIAFEPGLVERFRLLADIGLASEDPVEVEGMSVRPRDVLIALGRRLPQAAGTEDTECLRAIAVGSVRGEPATVVAESVVRPDPSLGAGGGGVDTGVPPSIVARMIAAGETQGGPGMWIPEQGVDADLFFQRLAERGVTYSLGRS
jgi:lysine 6-dehydrogenase